MTKADYVKQRVTCDKYYTEHDSLLSNECVYCGARANTVDHIPPVSLVFALELNTFKRLLKVRACKECNSALGAKALFTLESRREFIHERLKKKLDKYKGVLTAEEMETLGLD